MNRLQRRLLTAFVETGGDLGDERGLDFFAGLVRTNVLLLTARTRRAIELVLDGGEEVSYDEIAATLTHDEQRPVTVASVRQRVSRGGRLLEAAVRRSARAAQRAVAMAAGVAPGREAQGSTSNGQPVAAVVAASVPDR